MIMANQMTQAQFINDFLFFSSCRGQSQKPTHLLQQFQFKIESSLKILTSSFCVFSSAGRKMKSY